jgi:hypothetical protein
MVKNKNSKHQYIDSSAADELNKLGLNLFTCNYISYMYITFISSAAILIF